MTEETSLNDMKIFPTFKIGSGRTIKCGLPYKKPDRAAKNKTARWQSLLNKLCSLVFRKWNQILFYREPVLHEIQRVVKVGKKDFF